VRKILEVELDRLIEQNAKPQARVAAARRLVNFEPTHESEVRSLMKASCSNARSRSRDPRIRALPAGVADRA
jgi:hypothetical protein